MIRLLPCVALLLVLAAHADGPPKKDPPGPTVIRLARQANAPARALAYHLMPASNEEVDDNAAQLWLRAGINARSARRKWTEKELNWAGPSVTPLDKLPAKEVRAFLEKYLDGLDLADRAALRTRCRWDYKPLTIQTIAMTLAMEELMAMREAILVVNLRFRLELSEKRFDDARRSAQTGLALARHLGDSDLMVLDLYGMVLASMMMARLEEWVQIPDSPNLYWALTELPRPLVGIRRSIRNELGMIERSLPSLRDLRAKKLTEAQARDTYDRMFDAWTQGSYETEPTLMKGMARTAVVAKYYPNARKTLIAGGRLEKEVDAMPKLQVIALSFLEEYDRVRDEITKWLAAPAHQGVPEIEKIVARELANAKENTNGFLHLMVPSLDKIVNAQTRLDRRVASLRAAEALRQHVADHGKPPATWAELKGVPAPIDPYTGKGFDAFYKVVDGKGILEVPSMAGWPATQRQRYEVAPRVQ